MGWVNLFKDQSQEEISETIIIKIETIKILNF